MVKLIKLSRTIYENEGIQHNVILSVRSLLDDEIKIADERIRAMTILLETLCPKTILISSIKLSPRPVSEAMKNLKQFELSQRNGFISEGNEITLEQLKDIMLYCYSNGQEITLDVLDSKNQHVTAVINNGLVEFHFLYGTPESFTMEYVKTIKKKLKDYTFDGSFKKTL